MKPEVLKFIDYFQSFYGKNGLYDVGSTREEAMEATLIYLTTPGALTFEGDSFDRENIREVLFSRREAQPRAVAKKSAHLMMG
jgi:hypothetical protein